VGGVISAMHVMHWNFKQMGRALGVNLISTFAIGAVGGVAYLFPFCGHAITPLYGIADKVGMSFTLIIAIAVRWRIADKD